MIKTVKIWVFTKRKIIKWGIVAIIIGMVLFGTAMILSRQTAPVFNFSKTIKWPEVDVYELEVSAASKRELPVYSVSREDKKIALTIDAAWEDKTTAQLLQILNENDVRATFFLCKYWVENCAQYVIEIDKQGHEIGNHSATHPHMSKLDASQIRQELFETDDAIEKLIGKRSKNFRPPYGEYDNNVINASRAAGYEVIQWSVDSIDWQNDRSVQNIVDRIMKNTSQGGIILCHNNAKHILEYLPIVIKELKAKGFEFVTVSELLLEGETYIDSNGVMQKVSQPS